MEGYRLKDKVMLRFKSEGYQASVPGEINVVVQAQRLADEFALAQ
jgi:hypothetical protein